MPVRHGGHQRGAAVRGVAARVHGGAGPAAVRLEQQPHQVGVARRRRRVQRRGPAAPAAA